MILANCTVLPKMHKKLSENDFLQNFKPVTQEIIVFLKIRFFQTA